VNAGLRKASHGRRQAPNPSQGAGKEVRALVNEDSGGRPRYDLITSGPNPSEDGLVIKTKFKAGGGGTEDLDEQMAHTDARRLRIRRSYLVWTMRLGGL
jgi:hypothetical protein